MSYAPHVAMSLLRGLIAPVQLAGKQAQIRFRQAYDTDQKSDIDVLTSVDLECERLVLDAIRTAFPDHPVWSEEAGTFDGSAPWSWVLDPLDGTNNFVQGIPIFGVILGLFYEEQAVGGILYEPVQNDLIYGATGAGVFHNDIRLSPLSVDLPLRRATVGWTQGYAIKGDPVAQACLNRLDLSCKRVFQSWAPVFDSIRFLTGDFAALVSYDGEFTDFSAVRGLAPELGAIIMPFDPDCTSDRRVIIAPEVRAKEIVRILCS
jgi:myo-inositol-1(or 4)-monophosphatase